MTALCLFAALTLGQGDEKGLREGMSPARVKAILGQPARVARQILAHRAIEHWHYAGPKPLRLTFDCPRGQVPRLASFAAP